MLLGDKIKVNRDCRREKNRAYVFALSEAPAKTHGQSGFAG